MIIYTRIQFQWDGTQYVLTSRDGYVYNGNVDKLCGASKEQKDTYDTQAALTQTLITQMKAVFGASSSVFNDLVNTFTPVAESGPNQQGFSPAELAARNSAAIDTVGNQYEGARKAVAEQTAAIGGGNIALPSGAQIAPQLQLSESAAKQTSGELNQIQQENYATGRQNWITAAEGLERAPGVFSPATSAGGVSVGSGSAQGNTADAIAQANNSWVNAAFGALGAIGGAAIPKIPFSGGGSTPALANDMPDSFYQPWG